MTPMSRIMGWAWFLVPLILLAYEVWEGAHTEFLSFAFYIVVWGGLFALSLCGGWFLIGMPGAKWLLRLVAVAIYVIVIGLIAWGNAPYYGGHDFLFMAISGSLSKCTCS